MEEGGDDPQRPGLVSVGPRACIPTRRLSGSFRGPRRAATPRRLAWLSLQGRLEGAEEATSALSVGVRGKEGVAWEGFAPLQRVLVVAVVAAAAAESRRRKESERLRRSVELRDQLLRGMQQKLDDLCEQVYPVEDLFENMSLSRYDSDSEELEDCKGERLPNCYSEIDSFGIDSSSEVKDHAGNKPCTDGMFKDDVGHKPCDDEILRLNHWSFMEPEERRMSDLSDFCSSVTSSADIQLRVLAKEQESYNFQKQCQEKDAIISKLITDARAASTAGSRRISELEEIIKRKSLIITKLKKDVTFLEQKIFELARLRGLSFTPTVMLDSMDVPVITKNILYDLSSSSSSSSESETPKIEREDFCQIKVAQTDRLRRSNSITVENKRPLSEKGHMHKSRDKLVKQQSISSSKERTAHRQAELESSLRPKNFASSPGVSKKLRRHTRQEKRSISSQRRWV